MYHHNSEGELLVCLFFMVIIYMFNSSSNMLFIKPHVFFKINVTGIDKSQYNISSFSCSDINQNKHIATNITFPDDERFLHNLIFMKKEHSELPEYVGLVPLRSDSNNCLWGDEVFLKIKDKRENTDVSFYIPESGIYIINDYYQPKVFSES